MYTQLNFILQEIKKQKQQIRNSMYEYTIIKCYQQFCAPWHLWNLLLFSYFFYLHRNPVCSIDIFSSLACNIKNTVVQNDKTMVFVFIFYSGWFKPLILISLYYMDYIFEIRSLNIFVSLYSCIDIELKAFCSVQCL